MAGSQIWEVARMQCWSNLLHCSWVKSTLACSSELSGFKPLIHMSALAVVHAITIFPLYLLRYCYPRYYQVVTEGHPSGSLYHCI